MEIVILLNNNGCRADVVIKTSDPAIEITVNDFYQEESRESYPGVEYRRYVQAPALSKGVG
jgi:hypothetical protein